MEQIAMSCLILVDNLELSKVSLLLTLTEMLGI